MGGVPYRRQYKRGTTPTAGNVVQNRCSRYVLIRFSSVDSYLTNLIVKIHNTHQNPTLTPFSPSRPLRILTLVPDPHLSSDPSFCPAQLDGWYDIQRPFHDSRSVVKTVRKEPQHNHLIDLEKGNKLTILLSAQLPILVFFIVNKPYVTNDLSRSQK